MKKKLTEKYTFNDANVAFHNFTRGYRVYRNLHADCWSVQGWIDGKGWRVIGHCRAFRADRVSFVVNEKARLKVVASRKKNVHAFIVCKDIQMYAAHLPEKVTEVTYSPYVDPNRILGSGGVGVFFIDGPDLAVWKARTVFGTAESRVFAAS